jgi:TRAP-type C4-dicarboxylate transport system permease small subunit
MTTAIRRGVGGFVERVITGWALLGGIVLLCVVGVNVGSVVGAIIWKPFPGDFELTEMGTAVAVFAFLPYCQLSDANVTADIFTSGASDRWKAIFRLAASVAALAFGLILCWRMYDGLLDQKADHYTTAILQIPHWIAFVPILVSLGLLVLASALTLSESLRRATGGGPA